MDELAHRYLLLALRIGRLVPGFVDGYTGPPELFEAVAGEEPIPSAELHNEAMTLHELIAELPDGTPALARRRAWLSAQLVAMSAVCRHVGGEEIAFADLVEELCDTVPEPVPEDAFLAARRMLDDVLPPGPSLRDRLETHDRAVHVPAEQKMAAIVAMADVLRSRTIQDLWLPPGEQIDWLAAHDQPWGAYAVSLPGLRTQIRVNLDLPVGIGVVVYLASHQGYPGHHAERASKQALLARETGLGEASVNCLFTPESALSEGLAELAREVVLSDAEMGIEMGRLSRRLNLPIDAASIEREVRVSRVREVLRSAGVNAALKLYQEGRPKGEVREWLADTALMSEARIDHALRTMGGALWATVPFAYRLGLTLIREWLEMQGQTRGFRRLLREQLSPVMLRFELGEAPALYPADFI